ncbi:MAG: FlgD immunoglobulin-like domain containing protein [Bacteriovoracaceae bacterium]|nr:hypothetical protein [Bacteroidota bacterium]
MKLTLAAFSLFILFGSCINEPTTGPQTSIGTPPPDFFLKQNFPNPFADTTTIEFGVPASGGSASSVSIIVYDALLEPVRTLVNNSSHPSGIFRTKWSGINARGVQAAPGPYTIEMRGYTPQSTLIRIIAIKK